MQDDEESVKQKLIELTEQNLVRTFMIPNYRIEISQSYYKSVAVCNICTNNFHEVRVSNTLQ